MSLFYRVQGPFLVVFGQTFPVKEQIKALGGRFDGATKSWRVPHDEEKRNQLDHLCRQRGGGALEPQGPEETSQETQPLSLATDSERESSPFQAVKLEAREQNELLVKPSGVTQGSGETSNKKPEELAEFSWERAWTVRELLDRAQRVVSRAFTDSFWIIGEIHNMSSKQSHVFFDLSEAKDPLPTALEAYEINEDHAAKGQDSVRRDEADSVARGVILERQKKPRTQRSSPGPSTGATLTIRCVLWQDSLRKIRQNRGEEALDGALQDGLKVALRCRVQFYRDRAQLSLVVEDLDPAYTKGSLALMREKLLKELRSRGLDRANGRLEFPDFPFVVGLISAEGSRAYSDFTHQLEVLGFPGQVVFCGSPMQGDGVSSGVVAGLKILTEKGCDVIVITRGGGSAADLRWFDDRDIAFGIAQCPLPVIAAIGHHDDRCVAEEVCYQRQKTPTAAADFIMSVFQGVRNRIDEAHRQLLRGLTRRRDGFVQETTRLGENIGRLALRALEMRGQGLYEMGSSMERALVRGVMKEEALIAQIEAKIPVILERRISQEQDRVSRFQEALVKADPRPWLAQGWTQIQDETGHALRSVHEVHEGQNLRARLTDGVLELKMIKKNAKS